MILLLFTFYLNDQHFYLPLCEKVKNQNFSKWYGLPALEQLWEANSTFPINAVNHWVLRCGFLFCLKHNLSSSHSEGNVWRNFSRVFEVLIIAPFTMTNSMPNLLRLDELYQQVRAFCWPYSKPNMDIAKWWQPNWGLWDLLLKQIVLMRIR